VLLSRRGACHGHVGDRNQANPVALLGLIELVCTDCSALCSAVSVSWAASTAKVTGCDTRWIRSARPLW